MDFNFPVELINEGLANILVPRLDAYRKNKSDYAPSKAPVFFNKLMGFNRDIAILVLQAFQKKVGRKLSVAEPLTGCGVRGVRFAKEVTNLGKISINDINKVAYNMAQHNVKINKLTHRIQVTNWDANLFLSIHAAPYKRFDYIDVDPFGTPVTYLDSAIRATRDGGMLALTATDLAPLCGIYPRAALRKYGGIPLRTEYCKEIALRLLTGCLALNSAKHGIGIILRFSYCGKHYVRVYASLHYGVNKAYKSLQNLGYLLHCFYCFHRETISGIIPLLKMKCCECGSPLKIAGPLWLGRLSEINFLNMLSETYRYNVFTQKRRVLKTVSMVKTELDAPPTFFVLDKICDKFGLSIPPLKKVIRKLVQEGYQTLPTHFHTRGLKTDADAGMVTNAVRTSL
jgi:tRNA (guanine26-N2/guanine27-N2)-dimethyltransferase